MPFTYNKLCGKIREVYGTQAAFAEDLGINPATLSLKLNGKQPFNQLEIDNALKLLHIDRNEVADYFFSY